jgi:hypothetical protein
LNESEVSAMNIACSGAKCATLLVWSILLFPVTATFAQDPPAAAGVLWETTSQMTMEGMPFAPPAQTFKRCMPTEWTAPPGAGDEERGCVNSDFARVDNTVTWTSVCAGPPQMTGQGEVVFTDATGQAYTGKLNYASDEGSVVINLSGQVLGPCDNPR